ncbi:glycerol-3-phosphate dehydrogenase [NAD(+)], cytoplasmic [Galendromus occidentalis]|uniref:Glycerol-3-phosphate dehydrogenase [NAD(+)] n=1 Tax=Galendromus occidentalis TaxID=34638 RepID=A0AAJ6W0Q8_9ACAR|nr:glycerol-3-phosphate dehydrogenase [NAD(+)], cytoplasmic [Galendromus occidentalis]
MVHKVAIVGSGNWGSVIARIVGANVIAQPDLFDPTVNIHVYEELVDGKKLTEIINTQHENVKYLPGFKFPTNVVAIPDVVEACKDADIIIFVLPHKFVKPTCAPLVGKIKNTAIGVSLIKGFDIVPGKGITLISNVIKELLNIPCGVLMGANLANEVAAEKFCEATLGVKSPETGAVLKKLLQTNFFRITITDDISTIEVCGSIKNIVACGAGFVDGLGLGDNTKAAVIRLGLKEMIAFANQYYPGAKLDTFFESCGVADLVTTCYGGRNRRVSEAFVKAGGKKTIEELEKEMLNGMKLQGPETAAEVYEMLKINDQLERFPLFVAIHRICIGEIAPDKMVECIRNHPEHM